MNFKLKTGVIIMLTLLIASCVSYRNDYGRKRFACCKFTMKRNTNSEVYKIIDTTKIYKLVSVLNIEGKDSTYLKDINKYFLKFYADGKVGEFFSYDDISLNSLNPKKATIGVYKYSKGKLTIQTYLETAQGGGFVKNRLKKSTDHYLEFGDENNSVRYEKEEIPKEFLIYTPDW
ncbi:hypothetical protein [uncultured Croceitalea sp.]|uniref:hypothetical protein n=1 Tax=uncultured Croceitalea sp. TaxID=1798908 RepID=UPI0033065C3E